MSNGWYLHVCEGVQGRVGREHVDQVDDLQNNINIIN